MNTGVLASQLQGPRLCFPWALVSQQKHAGTWISYVHERVSEYVCMVHNSPIHAQWSEDELATVLDVPLFNCV